MDGDRFDRIVKGLPALTRRGGLRALSGGALAVALAMGAGGADARRRKKCKPPCDLGFACIEGECTCPSGVVCDGLCCDAGQVCLYYGACSWPVECRELGEPCKSTGRPCCDGLTCASGQGGMTDVACYRPAGAACASTAECVYDAQCIDGTCVANPPPPVDPYAGTCTRRDDSCVTLYTEFVNGRLSPRNAYGVSCTTIWGEPGHCYRTSDGQAYCAGYDDCQSSATCSSDGECRQRLSDATAVCIACDRCGVQSMCIGTKTDGFN